MTDKWISVEERLPEIRKVVLLYGSEWGDEPFTGYLRHDGKYRDLEVGGITASRITHWMPLPEPPKQ